MPTRQTKSRSKTAEPKPYLFFPINGKAMGFTTRDVLTSLRFRLWMTPELTGISRRHINQVIAGKVEPCEKLLQALSIRRVA